MQPSLHSLENNQRLIAATVADSRANATTYQQMIGSLMYLVTATRPDLTYTIAHLSQYSSDPSEEHFSGATRVLRYLQGTKIRALLFS